MAALFPLAEDPDAPFAASAPSETPLAACFVLHAAARRAKRRLVAPSIAVSVDASSFHSRFVSFYSQIRPEHRRVQSGFERADSREHPSSSEQLGPHVARGWASHLHELMQPSKPSFHARCHVRWRRKGSMDGGMVEESYGIFPYRLQWNCAPSEHDGCPTHQSREVFGWRSTDERKQHTCMVALLWWRCLECHVNWPSTELVVFHSTQPTQFIMDRHPTPRMLNA